MTGAVSRRFRCVYFDVEFADGKYLLAEVTFSPLSVVVFGVFVLPVHILSVSVSLNILRERLQRENMVNVT